MSLTRRQNSNGLNVVLILVFDLVLVNQISAAEETCGEINGQSLCYFKAWDFGVDWETASQLCQSRNSTLPATRDRNEQDAFEKFLNIHMGVSAVWTSGRSYTYDNWTWLDGRTYSRRVPDAIHLPWPRWVWIKYFHCLSHCLAGEDHRYFHDLIERRGHQRYQPVILDFRFLDSANPSRFFNYMCQYSGDLCNNFNDTFNTTKGCITFSHDQRSWYDARNQCLITGGDLAKLYSADLLSSFRNIFDSLRGLSLWIGLRKTSWRWNLNNNASEEDEIKYTSWAKDWNPLTGDCISIDALNGKWRTTQCSDKLKVVCQTDSAKATSSESTTVTNNYCLPVSLEQQSPSVSYPTFISVVVVALCAILISNVIVVFVVRKYIFYHSTAHVASSRETRNDDRIYQDLETTRRQAKPDGRPTYAELKLQPLYEEVCQRGH